MDKKSAAGGKQFIPGKGMVPAGKDAAAKKGAPAGKTPIPPTKKEVPGAKKAVPPKPAPKKK